VGRGIGVAIETTEAGGACWHPIAQAVTRSKMGRNGVHVE
jgi:hypothetical protein